MGRTVESASFGDQVEVILPKTGFYIESGGQVSDTGSSGRSRYRLSTPEESDEGWEIEVTEMRKPSAGVIVHVGEVISGQPKVGDQAVAEVDMPRRHDIMRNHTATHLLHAALHQVLGAHARQAGSLVAPDRLRFDFNHPEAMTPEQIERVEKIVNDAVAADMEVISKLKAREDAIAEGAMALFGEKYGETVRTITITGAFANLPGARAMAEPAIWHGDQPDCGRGTTGKIFLRTVRRHAPGADLGRRRVPDRQRRLGGGGRAAHRSGHGTRRVRADRAALQDPEANRRRCLKSSLEEVPQKVESLQDEVADLKKRLQPADSSGALSLQHATGEHPDRERM